MSEVLEKVISISPSGEVTSWKKEDLKLGYRSSVFMIEGGIVAEAVLKLRRGNVDEIQAIYREYIGGNSDLWRKVWTIYTFLVWYEEYFVKRA